MKLSPRSIWWAIFFWWYIIYQISPLIKHFVDDIVVRSDNIIKSVPHLKEAVEFQEENFTQAVLVWAVVTWVWSLVWGAWEDFDNKRKFERRDYSHMLWVPVMWIHWESWELKIKNEVEEPWNKLLEWEAHIQKMILNAVRKVNKKDLVLELPEKDEWEIYRRLRENKNIFAGRENALEEAAKWVLGVPVKSVKFIWMLTREPQYTLDSQTKHAKELSSNKEEPYTKAQTRLSMFPEIQLNEIIKWCEERDRSMAGQSKRYPQWVLHTICQDTNDCCPELDLLVCHLLQKNCHLNEDEGVTSALKFPTYRKKILTMTHVARAYSQKRAHLSITKEIDELNADDQIST